jgi:hypothetical protein
MNFGYTLGRNKDEMKYFSTRFIDVPKMQRYDNIVYVILLTLVLIYFPKGILPKQVLTEYPDLQNYRTSEKFNTYGITSSQFTIPFVGCFTRYTGTIIGHTDPYTRHLWDYECGSLNFDYKIIREGKQFKLYYFRPLGEKINMNENMKAEIESNFNFVIRNAFQN